MINKINLRALELDDLDFLFEIENTFGSLNGHSINDEDVHVLTMTTMVIMVMNIIIISRRNEENGADQEDDNVVTMTTLNVE